MMKFDYTLKTPEERVAFAERFLEETPNVRENYLEYLANYILDAADKQTPKKDRKLITDNKMVTIKKRETSFEGLAEHFECGEDGIYNLIKQDKHIIFAPKKTITKSDIAAIPYLQTIKDSIAYWESVLKTAKGKDIYVIKQTIIELRKDQYALKESVLQPDFARNPCHSLNYVKIESAEWMGEDQTVRYSGASLCNPKVCEIILNNYSGLKEAGYENFISDTWYFMEDFDNISAEALKNYPIYESIVTYKIDGLQNQQIQQKLMEEFGISYSLEYISSLWRKKIPKLIAAAAEDQFLDWYFLNVEKGKYKTCSRCKKSKLALHKYFTKNKTSSDGFYSICRECRNKKVVPLMQLDKKV